MSDLISKQTAIDAILEDLTFDSVKELRAYVSKNKQDDYFYGGILHAINAVQDLSSAQPEVIRCKDCKQFRRWIDTKANFCDRTETEVSSNDFCSRAERRTDEGET